MVNVSENCCSFYQPSAIGYQAISHQLSAIRLSGITPPASSQQPSAIRLSAISYQATGYQAIAYQLSAIFVCARQSAMI